MQRDPSRGTSLPLADKIIMDPSVHVDLYGPINPRIVRAPDVAGRNVGAGKKVIRPPRPGQGHITKR